MCTQCTLEDYITAWNEENEKIKCKTRPFLQDKTTTCLFCLLTAFLELEQQW